MKFLRRSWFKIFGMTCLLWMVMGGMVWACDIAVVAAGANPEGRPLIWKDYDDSTNWQEEIKYYSNSGNGGNYILLHYNDSYTQYLTGDATPRSPGSMRRVSPWRAPRSMRITSLPATNSTI